jgi:beta-lactamase regulating signal transducer with metallopeptidase domain
LALAHELAHIKRRDLAWNWLPAAAKAVFFVNPLVWVAGRELGIAQEMACDEMAARASGAGFARYGRLLLTMVRPRRSAEPTWAVAAVSAGASAKVMRRRLIELGHAQDPPAARLGGSVVALLVVCALVMPFQVVEAPRRETPRARGSSIRVEVSAPEPSPLLHPRFVKLVFRPHD